MNTDVTLQQPLAIALSREELYVVMRLLKATSIPGFDLGWLNTMPGGSMPDEMRRALEVAANALVARGYLTPLHRATGTAPLTLGMPALVISLVGACTFGIDSISLNLRVYGRHRLIYLHELRRLGVVHTMPLPDVHQFEAVNGRAGILKVIDNALDLGTQTASTLPAGKALVVDVEAARDAAVTGQVDKAVELLVHAGLQTVTAQALGRAMAEATALGAIGIVRRDADGRRHEATLALVVTSTQCFTLSDEGSHPAAFHVQPTSANALRQWINSSLPREPVSVVPG